MRFFLIFVVMMALSSMAMSATINVPKDYSTIQAAIDASVNGDTVLVSSGTYVENLNFKGKAITVKSTGGASQTIIDGNSATVVYFICQEGPDSVLDGFTITNGGGGIHCSSTSPTITNNIISGNYAWHGAGIYCDGLSSPSSPIITNNIIANNKAIEGNLNGSGGGIYCATCSPIITNNIISNNFAELKGGGIECVECSLTITNNTISENYSFLMGGGIYCTNDALITITNSIFWNNTAIGGSEIWIGGFSKPSTLSIEYSDVKGGKASIFADSGSNLIWGAGMIDADPLFVGPANNDCHLSFQSPCKNTGDNSSVTNLYDFECDPRIANGMVDMGADEFHTHLYYTGNASPGSNINLKFIDTPSSSPVILWLGSGVLNPPMSLPPHGDWYLQFPILLQAQLGSIPGPDGVLSLPCTIPGNLPPVGFPLQAGIGMKLTNLLELKIQ